MAVAVVWAGFFRVFRASLHGGGTVFSSALNGRGRVGVGVMRYSSLGGPESLDRDCRVQIVCVIPPSLFLSLLIINIKREREV